MPLMKCLPLSGEIPVLLEAFPPPLFPSPSPTSSEEHDEQLLKIEVDLLVKEL